MEDLSAFSARPRLAALLNHFAEIADTRQGWKVMYPLREVLFLVVCGTIASGDDYDDIVDWGKAHLAFLRGFAEFHFGIPCADWLRFVMNRIDPAAPHKNPRLIGTRLRPIPPRADAGPRPWLRYGFPDGFKMARREGRSPTSR